MDRDDFLMLADMLATQYSKDMNSAVADNADLWSAALKMLSLIFGKEGGLMVERWIFDSESGSFPAPDFPYRNASELWDALRGM